MFNYHIFHLVDSQVIKRNILLHHESDQRVNLNIHFRTKSKFTTVCVSIVKYAPDYL